MRLVLHTAAYWLMLTVRDAIPKAHALAKAEFATIRLRLLKLAARVIETASRVRLAFAAACPEAVEDAGLPIELVPVQIVPDVIGFETIVRQTPGETVQVEGRRRSSACCRPMSRRRCRPARRSDRRPGRGHPQSEQRRQGNIHWSRARRRSAHPARRMRRERWRAHMRRKRQELSRETLRPGIGTCLLRGH